MEVIKHYQGLDEIIESMAKIANNLEEMTRIQKMYEGSNPLDCDQEIQSLKLENDRLQQRDKLMIHFIESVACKPDLCNFCDMYNYEDDDHKCCILNNRTLLEDIADELLKKLEEL